MAIKNITVPDIGGAADVDVIEVLVKAGDTIAIDTPLLTLESDKATMEVPSSDAGVVKEVKVKPGAKVSSGSVILVLETQAAAAAPEKAAPQATKPAAEKAPAPAAAPAAKAQPEATTAMVKTVVEGELADIHAGPAVRRIAREFGVQLADVPATGPKSRILKEDIQSYVKSRLATVPATTSGNGMGLPSMPVVDFSKFGPVEEQPLSRIN